MLIIKKICKLPIKYQEMYAYIQNEKCMHIFRRHCSYNHIRRRQFKIDAVIIVISNEKTYFSVSYYYGLIESLFQSYSFSRKSCLQVYRVIIAIQLYLKKLEIYEVMDLIFTRKNLYLLEDYIYDLYLKTFQVIIIYHN